MSNKNVNGFQYQAPAIPPRWGLEERRFYAGVMALFDQLFAQRVNASRIADGSIVSAKLADGSVISAKIADGSVTMYKLGEKAVQTFNLADTAVTEAKLADGSVTHLKVGTGEIQAANIADAAIETAKIANGAITNAQIGEAAVGAANIQNAAVDTAKIALGAITAALIAQGAIGTAQIADASITDAKIVEMTANKITSGVLETERLIIRDPDGRGVIFAINNTGNIEKTEISTDTIDGDVMTRRSITADKLVAKAITAEEIAAETITANEIMANTITAEQIAAGSITGQEIAAESLTVNHVNSDFGRDLDLSSNESITAKVTHEMEQAATTLETTLGGMIQDAIVSMVARDQYDADMQIVQSDYTQMLQSNNELNVIVGSMSSDLAALMTYFSFTQEGLLIGKAGSIYKSLFANDSWTIMRNDAAALQIAENATYIPRLNVENSLTFGVDPAVGQSAGYGELLPIRGGIGCRVIS